MAGSELGRRLKGLRAEKANRLGRRKIPQREIAAELQVSPGAYGSWETGRTKPDIDMLPRIADYFGVSIDDLLERSVDAQVRSESIIRGKFAHWKLRRRPETEEEQATEVWERLAEGQSPERIAADLRLQSPYEIERRYLQDVIISDLIDITHVPQDAGLAERVQRACGLREVLVAPVPEESGQPFRTVLLGEVARQYFQERVSAGMKVGLAGGSSVSRLVYALRRGECRSIEVYPLAISPVIEAVALDANSLVGAFAYRHDGYDVRGYALQYTSPSVSGKTFEYENAPTRRILAKAKSIDIAFMGLGTLERERAPIDLLGDLLHIGPGLGALQRKGAVGDILYHLVNHRGDLVSPEISKLICSIEPKDLKELVELGVRVVVIASGEEKAEIARVAITAGYANVFIIDHELARALL